MAKTFKELNSGDTIYYISISPRNYGERKNNCSRAYKIAMLDFAVFSYPYVNFVEECKVNAVIPTDNLNYVNIEYIWGKFRRFNTFESEKNIKVNRLYSDRYDIYSTSEKEARNKAKEIIHALIEINRNRMIETNKCYKEILSKLNNNL